MSVDASVMSEDTASALASIQKSLERMEEKLSGVTADVEDLKKAAKPPGLSALHPGDTKCLTAGKLRRYSHHENHVVRENGPRIRG